MKNNLYLLILLAFTWSTENIFVACEGNFYEGNGSLWTITEDDIYEYQENPLGDIVQSLYVFENQLFVIVNGSSNIQVFNIEDDGLTPVHYIDTHTQVQERCWFTMDIYISQTGSLQM